MAGDIQIIILRLAVYSYVLSTPACDFWFERNLKNTIAYCTQLEYSNAEKIYIFWI